MSRLRARKRCCITSKAYSLPRASASICSGKYWAGLNQHRNCHSERGGIARGICCFDTSRFLTDKSVRNDNGLRVMSFTKCLTTFWKILVIAPGWIAPGFIITFMDERLPLPSLLSQALVAFTIEFDNEAERTLPHRTTRHGSTSGLARGPWLVSQVMWSNCMRFVSEEGITVRELERVARTKT